jgi:Tol biopolymer transport system component
MSLATGTRLGPYEIVAPLGAGGMGEVYRARDTQLKREVALKVLPAAFTNDADRLARFQREAELLATLNHPHIAAIYGLERTAETTALVLELVEGETLAERIARGPIPLDEALPLARQISEALAAAHDRGIIHRDLKPSNIKVRADGTAKVLDFGLAKALEGPSGDHSGGTALSLSPTITSPTMTTAGVILGTAAYMAPEQARGRSVDRRSDLWAFGCVLYEMLTSRKAFPGDDVTETLAAVLKEDPDLAALPAATPIEVRRLLRRCFSKDPARRLADASTARLEIDEALAGRSDDSTAIERGHGSKRRWMVPALVLMAFVTAGALAWALRPMPLATPQVFDIVTPATSDPVSLDLSPDGEQLAFAAPVDGRMRLWIQSIRTGEVRSLRGTEGARYPFWSPDSKALGFFADGRLKTIDLAGEVLKVLASSRTAYGGTGGTWGPDGTILFSGSDGPVVRTTTGGDAPVEVTKRMVATNDRFPRFLPDGKHFLYLKVGAQSAVYVGSIDGSVERRLFTADSPAFYHASGHLLFVRDGRLFAQKFDSIALTPEADPIPVSDNVAVNAAFSTGVAVAGDIIAYRSGEGGGRRQLAMFDRSGRELETFDHLMTDGSFPSLSPDGQRVLFQELPSNTSGSVLDIWLYDLRRKIPSPFVATTGVDAMPLWSHDATRVVFSGVRQENRSGLFIRSALGSSAEQLLLPSQRAVISTDWSARYLLYDLGPPRSVAGEATTGWDIMALPMPTGDPLPVAAGSADEHLAQLSPDSSLVAYQSNETGQYEIILQSFPDKSRYRQQVSRDGGGHVRWRQDGKEIYYLGIDDRLMSVSVSRGATGESALGEPMEVFRAPVRGDAIPFNFSRQQYAVRDNGQRFLFNKVVDTGTTAPIKILLHWSPLAARAR